MAKILLIEDDTRIASFVQRGLEAEGHVIDLRHNGRDGLEAARQNQYGLIILDRSLPFVDGMEVCRILRGEGRRAYILMLTARDTLRDKLDGLRDGADDYMTKPFAFDELVARVDALVRRSVDTAANPTTLATTLTVADLVLDRSTKRLRRGDRDIPLTAKEFALLEYLMSHPDEVVSRQRLLSNIWGLGFDPGTKIVDVYIRYVRRKIDHDGESSLIQTVRGFGYRIEHPDDGASPNKASTPISDASIRRA